ncbi:peptidase inhibitor i9 [Phlyctema vagabunda]|uniref:Peptidase inhibitor i9 n=1 Tax=Phlyctema vagabunda TaxID=108571 RepID=A0ABR4PVZ4_9HELO
MPNYIVGVKKGLSEEQYKEAEKHITDQGAKIVSTYDRNGVMPGFVVSHEKDAVTTMEKGPHVEFVEADGVVKTQ